MLEDARRQTEEAGMRGLTGMAAFSLARLHASQGRDDEARAELTTCIEFLRGAGVREQPREVAELANRVGGVASAT
jgi:hypothetical protein